MRWPRALADLLAAVLFVAVCLAGTALHRANVQLFEPSALVRGNDWEKLVSSSLKDFFIIDFVRRYVPASATVLVLNQNAFIVYAGRKLVRDLDVRMLPVYGAPDTARAHAELLKLGVEYIFVPGYDFPTQYNTVLGSIMADPRLCELLLESQSRLYRLRRHPLAGPIEVERTLSRHEEWQTVRTGSEQRAEPVGGRFAVSGTPQESVRLYSGSRNLNRSPDRTDHYIGGQPEAAYLLNGALRGRGWATIYFYEYGGVPGENFVAGTRVIRSMALSGETVAVAKQLRASANATDFRIIMDVHSDGPIEVTPFVVERIRDRLKYGLEAVSESRPAHRPLELQRGSGWVVDRYAGPGSWWYPPSVYGDRAFRTSASGSRSFVVSMRLSGTGEASVIALAYGPREPRAVIGATARIELAPAPADSVWIVSLPAQFDELRVGWSKLRDPSAELNERAMTLFKDALGIGRSRLDGELYVHDATIRPLAGHELDAALSACRAISAYQEKVPILCRTQ